MADSKNVTGRRKGKQKAEHQDQSQDELQDDPQTLDVDAREAHNAHIMSKIDEYQKLNSQDDVLWRTFRRDFLNWDEETFSQCSPARVEKLREILRHHGVWVMNDSTIPAEQSLTETLYELEQVPWTQSEMLEHLDLEGSFNSRSVNSLLRRNGLLPQASPAVPPQASPTVPPAPIAQRLPQGGTPTPTPYASRVIPPTTKLGRLPVSVGSDARDDPSGLPLNRPPSRPVDPPLTPQHEHQPIPARPTTPEPGDWYGEGFRNNPRHNTTRRNDPLNFDRLRHSYRTNPRNERSYDRGVEIVEDLMDNYRSGHWNDSGDRVARSLATLEKMYKEDSKYSGQKETGQNDNFDHKLGIFEEMCFKANVPDSAKNLAYSTMLRGPALDHYFTNIRYRARTTPFAEMCTVTRQYFEGPKHVRSIVA
jgi:hypothetical protein